MTTMTKPAVNVLDITLTDEQKETINTQGYVKVITLDPTNSVEPFESMDVTLNAQGQYVEPQYITENEIPEQPKNVMKAEDVVWYAQHNSIHARLRVTQIAHFNNGKFFVGMTEAGHYSMFYKVLGKLNDNIKLESKTLQGALEEAAIQALIITQR